MPMIVPCVAFPYFHELFQHYRDILDESDIRLVFVPNDVVQGAQVQQREAVLRPLHVLFAEFAHVDRLVLRVKSDAEFVAFFRLFADNQNMESTWMSRVNRLVVITDEGERIQMPRQAWEREKIKTLSAPVRLEELLALLQEPLAQAEAAE